MLENLNKTPRNFYGDEEDTIYALVYELLTTEPLLLPEDKVMS